MKIIIKGLVGTVFCAAITLSTPALSAEKAKGDVSVDVYLQCLSDKEKAQQDAHKLQNHLFCLKMNCPKTSDLKECAAKSCGFEL